MSKKVGVKESNDRDVYQNHTLICNYNIYNIKEELDQAPLCCFIFQSIWCQGGIFEPHGKPHTPLKRGVSTIPPPRRASHYTQHFLFVKTRYLT